MGLGERERERIAAAIARVRDNARNARGAGLSDSVIVAWTNVNVVAGCFSGADRAGGARSGRNWRLAVRPTRTGRCDDTPGRAVAPIRARRAVFRDASFVGAYCASGARLDRVRRRAVRPLRAGRFGATPSRAVAPIRALNAVFRDASFVGAYYASGTRNAGINARRAFNRIVGSCRAKYRDRSRVYTGRQSKGVTAVRKHEDHTPKPK